MYGHHGRHRMRHLRGSRHSLQRRLFVWFGVTIVLTGLVVGVVFALLGPGGPHLRRDLPALEELVVGQLATVWDRPPERHALLERLAQALDMDVALEDARGTLVDGAGGPCRHSRIEVPVRSGDRVLGVARACPRHRPMSAVAFVAATSDSTPR